MDAATLQHRDAKEWLAKTGHGDHDVRRMFTALLPARVRTANANEFQHFGRSQR